MRPRARLRDVEQGSGRAPDPASRGKSPKRKAAVPLAEPPAERTAKFSSGSGARCAKGIWRHGEGLASRTVPPRAARGPPRRSESRAEDRASHEEPGCPAAWRQQDRSKARLDVPAAAAVRRSAIATTRSITATSAVVNMAQPAARATGSLPRRLGQGEQDALGDHLPCPFLGGPERSPDKACTSAVSVSTSASRVPRPGSGSRLSVFGKRRR